jgi:3-dehydroquinate synthase
MPQLKVSLGERSYRIIIQPGVLKRTGEILSNFPLSKTIMVITNPTVSAFYLEPLLDSLVQAGFNPSVSHVLDGEEYKNLDWVRRLYDDLLMNRMDRGSAVIALGGGVIGDIAGFVAATYMRGVPFVQIPTTLLAQVDSSIGGKVAVNHPKGKNIIGSFYQPIIVLIDPCTLRTLDKRELSAGFAEVVKYGVIKDGSFFSFLSENVERVMEGNLSILAKIILRSCEIKKEVVERDERERGIRAILNYGHTIGHALEAASHYRRFKHGEAVSIGMVGAAKIALKMGRFDRESGMRQIDLLRRSGLPVEFKEIDIDEIFPFIFRDKKSYNEELRFILPKRIGEVEIVTNVPEEVILQVLKEQRAR